MGLIYVSSESAAFISALKSNVASSKEAMQQLESGSQKVISAVDGHQLSGAAYTAGKGLFSDLILPTIARTTNAIEQIEQELRTYETADMMVASEGELDEDKLNQKIQTTQAMKMATEFTAKAVKAQATLNPIAGVLDTLLGVQQSLDQMADSFEQDIQELKNKLQKLQQFDDQTRGLFRDSLNELKLAMQSVLILNNTTVLADGYYSLPSGVDKSYFKEIKQEIATLLEPDKIEIKTIETPTEKIYQVYKNGQLDQKLTNAFYEKVVLPGAWEEAKVLVPQLVKDLSGYTDLEIIFDDHSSFLKKSWSVVMLIPAASFFKTFRGAKLTRAVKGAKYIDDAGLLKKAENLNNLPISANAGNHLANVEGFAKKKGIVGGHNATQFFDEAARQRVKVLSETPHPSIPGIKDVNYKVPRKNMDGTLKIPPEYTNDTFTKTVYDSKLISDEQMYQWGQEAMKNSVVDNRDIIGIASNGLKFKGYIENGEITNFFPILD